METKNLTSKQEQAGKRTERQEALVRQMQVVRMNGYRKNLDALLKGKGQNAPE